MKKTIVMADNDLSVLKMTKVRLEHEGFQVMTAVNGQEALDLVTRVLPDLVLLDIHMPQLDGFRVCEELKKNPKTEKIAVIILTGTESRLWQMTDRCIQLGIQDWVKKPFESKVLLEKINKALHEDSCQGRKAG